MIKKCIGCGCTLQSEEPDKEGYVLNAEQDYCQRCFRLIHYGDSRSLRNEQVCNKDVLKIYKDYHDDIFVVIVEVFDALVMDLDSLLKVFREFKIILVINKIDLLPYNVKDEKLGKLITTVLRKCENRNILNCLITYNKDPYFNELFYETLAQSGLKRVVFAGRVNAGKSSLINRLCKDSKLTVSTFPGTTVRNNIIVNGEYEFIDTPGLNDEESFVNWLDKDLIKELIPLKTIKAKTFQCYDEQAYTVAGLVSLEVQPKANVSLNFYINNMLEVHRTKLENNGLYLEKHADDSDLKLLPMADHEFAIRHSSMFYLKGLGYIKVKGPCNINIKVNSRIRVYKCEVEF